MSNSLDNPVATVIAKCRGTLWFVALLSGVINILLLSLPLYMLQLFDRVLVTKSVQTLILLTVLAVSALCIYGILLTVRERILNRMGIWLERQLAHESFLHDLSRPNEKGGLLKNLQQLRIILGSQALPALFDLPWAPFYIFVIYLMSPTIGMVAIVGAVLLVACALLNEAAPRKSLQRYQQFTNILDSQVHDAKQAREVVSALGMGPALLSGWFRVLKNTAEAARVVSDRLSIVGAVTKATRQIIQVAILATGAFMFVLDNLTPGIMMACAIIASRAYAPLEQLIGGWRQLMSARMAYHNLHTHLRTSKQPKARSLAFQNGDGHLRVSNVYFHYPGERQQVIKNLNFELTPGMVLAVLGNSGSGKSSLGRLLAGVHRPTSGSVNFNGYEVSNWPITELGRSLGYVSQDLQLLETKISENISRGFADCDYEVVEAAKMAGCHDIICNLPDDYDTIVQAGKLPRSLEQSIAVARAVFGEPQLLVLDDPDVHMDKSLQTRLCQAIDYLRSIGSIIVLFTQNNQLITVADTILVLEEGGTKAYGSTDKLLVPADREKKLGNNQKTSPHQIANRQSESDTGSGTHTIAGHSDA